MLAITLRQRARRLLIGIKKNGHPSCILIQIKIIVTNLAENDPGYCAKDLQVTVGIKLVL